MEQRGLGIGIVWWPALDRLCREGEGLIDVIEAEPEAFWAPAPDGSGFSSLLAEALQHLRQPKLLHGVGAPVGGTCPPPDGHSVTLADDVARLHPEFVSEHLSFTRFRPRLDDPPVPAGFMLPPLQGASGVSLAAANIRRHRAALGGLPVAVENPVSYLPPAPGEWPDGTFVAAVAEAADCGILLDLHNVLTNARNGRQSVASFCEALPKERVWELHLAGGESEAGFHLDAHAGLMEPELMEITAALVPLLPNLFAITFEIMPERVAQAGLSNIGRQIGKMRDLWNLRSADYRPSGNAARTWPSTEPPVSHPVTWEAALGCAINGLEKPAMDDAATAWWRSAEPALDLYRMLVGEGRASAVMSAAPRTTRLLLRQCSGPGTRRILADFWCQSTPGYTAADEARALFRFLSAAHAALPGLSDAIALDVLDLTK
jgi:uncharacterized protein (UPF0276 family)